ncbi:hypothetical protein QCA50_003388 [Cerrena zonata]|uniref:Uncharacterized protein n=1 Tax=Cerrena zonata TaxID=2478898 RepID=A0AAW0GK59_9APHY
MDFHTLDCSKRTSSFASSSFNAVSLFFLHHAFRVHPTGHEPNHRQNHHVSVAKKVSGGPTFPSFFSYVSYVFSLIYLAFQSLSLLTSSPILSTALLYPSSTSTLSSHTTYLTLYLLAHTPLDSRLIHCFHSALFFLTALRKHSHTQSLIVSS